MKPALDIVSPTTGEVVPFPGQNGQTTRTALALPEEMSFEEWASLGEALATAERSVMWWIGDWWAYGEHQYGERARLLEELAANGRQVPSFRTCHNAGTVARKFKSDRRRSRLPFSHHQEVAALEPEIADWLLDRAEQSDLSKQELRSEVRKLKLGKLIRPGERRALTMTEEDLWALVTAGHQFGTIYADPPWPYGNQATRAATKNHYKAHNELSVEQICALPVEQLTAEAAHCHLWTTNGFLREAFDVMEAWGFTYKSCFVWVKPDFGIGNYWRVGTEYMLFGIKGRAPFADNSQQNWDYLEAGEHSAKPPKIRRIIEKVSPVPRLELFGRKEVDGWVVWGNEIERAQSEVERLL